MITYRTNRRQYPVGTIIGDLLDRDGPATPDSFSPLPGQHEEFKNQFKGRAMLLFDRKRFLQFKTNTDFDPRAKAYPLRLEETPDSVVNEYFREYCIGYKTRVNGDYTNKLMRSMQPVGVDTDTGDTVPLTELSVDYYEDTLDRREQLERLTYVIHRIWNESVECKANLFSFTIAYADMLRREVISINRHSFRSYAIEKKLLKVKNNEPFSHEADIKYSIYTGAMDIFIFRSSEIFQYCKEFIKLLSELGYNAAYEDPNDYTGEWVDTIPCLGLPSDSELGLVQLANSIFNDTTDSWTCLCSDKFDPRYVIRAAEKTMLSNADVLTDNLDKWKRVVCYFAFKMSYEAVMEEPKYEKILDQCNIIHGIVHFQASYLFCQGTELQADNPMNVSAYRFVILENGTLLTVLGQGSSLDTRAFIIPDFNPLRGESSYAWTEI